MLESPRARGRRAPGGVRRPVDTAADDVAIIAFTSGTTGSRRAACTSTATCSPPATRSRREILGPQPDEVFCRHAAARVHLRARRARAVPAALRGLDGARAAQPGPEPVLEAIARARHRPRCSPRRPPTGRCCGRREPADLDSLRDLRVGRRAAPAPAWPRRGTSGPASASSTGSGRPRCCTSSSPPGRRTRGPGSMRAARPGLRGADRRHADWRRSPAGEVGRLAVRGPTGCRYLDDERQSQYVVDGWNLTGDAFRMDDDGYFWFQARTDDMIISSGYNISGFEVEAALLEHPAVAECAVVAAPDEERGHVVKAFVVLRPEEVRRAGRCRTTSRPGSRRTSTRASSSSWTRCRARPTGKVQRTRCRGTRAMTGRCSRRAGRARAATPTASPRRASSCSSPG